MARLCAILLVVASVNAATTDKVKCTKDSKDCYQELHGKVPVAGTCGDLRDAYKEKKCCGFPKKQTNLQLVPMNPHKSTTANPCEGAKPTDAAFANKPCFKNEIVNAMEQSGADVTKGFEGGLDSSSKTGPILTDYFTAGLCPVNVHWHLGSEHRSMGQYDESGKGPEHHLYEAPVPEARRLSGESRLGFRCHHFDKAQEKFTTPYMWNHCADMVVGETYEIHWPHSKIGACQTPNQYQTPFYDGVFCKAPGLNATTIAAVDVAKTVGVQAQVFTIVNDELYYYPDLFRGMIVDGEYGADIAIYTGSTTGTSRDNKLCSAYAPITWQVDRKCHLISASSFDKMCADMKSQKDDMSEDLVPHGARELVLKSLSANNQVDAGDA